MLRWNFIESADTSHMAQRRSASGDEVVRERTRPTGPRTGSTGSTPAAGSSAAALR